LNDTRLTMLPGLNVLRAVPERTRKPQANIPQTLGERERLRKVIAAYVANNCDTIVPPLVIAELKEHSAQIVSAAGVDPIYSDYIGVLLSNEAWREHLATIPYDRRLLLLPKCLRVESRCPAPFDDFGLLCRQCGLCSIQDLQNEAEKLGYAVLVAEGSALVMSLIQTGKIEAIVGVSCLSVLERAFPYMEAAAIPGIAIPLLQDDCIDTTVDLDWVWDVIHLSSSDRTRRMDLDKLRGNVETWFDAAAIVELLETSEESPADKVAREWLSRAGKRWRPFLTACAYTAFQEDPDALFPTTLKRVAVAVECFHKASLIHDDIEDDDALRYGEPALHIEYGVPVALNAGDLLIGEGYRLLAHCDDLPAAIRNALVRIASAGHRKLCLGQGTELEWARNPRPLTSVEVLEIFRLKTSPAFEVALRVGAAYGRASEDVHDTLSRYSDALGIAYQIRDDIEDLTATYAPDDLRAMRPSLPLAIAYERATGAAKVLLQRAWTKNIAVEEASEVRRLITETGAEERCKTLLEMYKEQAIQTLPDLQNASLKGLLRRVVGKIFRVEIKGWCSEFETRNATSGAASATATR
jgi:geranylgeranyl diphosphate synthase, type II